MNNTAKIFVYSVTLFLCISCKPLRLKLEKVKDEASCKYIIKTDEVDYRNPRIITEVECILEDCDCQRLQFKQNDSNVFGACVQLKTTIQVSFNGTKKENREINYGCVCVPRNSLEFARGRKEVEH